jgi:hypothetical protein
MRRWLLILGVVSLMAACVPQEEQGPRLVREVTVVATDILPTRVLSPTPPPITQEVPSILQMPTSNADFVLVTPTLPPSKTPTTTPTHTLTPTLTLTPTITTTATSTSFLLPTSEIIAVTAPVAANNNQICLTNWFFIQPRPASCPLNVPTASNGVYQTFQNGTMIWVGSQDAIYIMYNDAINPRWQVVRDYFEEGMPENGGFTAPGAGLYQPRRGFGLLWRNNEIIRNRVGWANIEWEMPYSVQVQTSNDGSLFLSVPGSGVIGLLPNGTSWTMYSSVPSPASSGSVLGLGNSGVAPTAIPVGP